MDVNEVTGKEEPDGDCRRAGAPFCNRVGKNHLSSPGRQYFELMSPPVLLVIAILASLELEHFQTIGSAYG